MITGGTFTSGATPILATVGGPVGIATAATSSALIAGGTIAAAHGIVLHKNYDKLKKLEISNSNKKNKIEFKKPKPNISGKEGAKDVPSWAKGNRPYKYESGKDFAKRLLDERYGKIRHKTGPRSDFNRIKKWGDRAFE